MAKKAKAKPQRPKAPASSTGQAVPVPPDTKAAPKPPAPQVPGGFDWHWLLVGGLALAVRLVYLAHIRDNPFFEAPFIDAKMYDQRAMDMITTGVNEKAFYQAPFYSALLALQYSLFGHDYLIPRLAQAFMGSGTALMVMALARHLFGRTEGLVAGVFMAFYGPAVFFEGELLREGLLCFQVTGLLLLLLWWHRRPSWLPLLLAGLLTGVSIITRENILLFVPAAAAWIAWQAREQRLVKAFAFLAAAALPVLPVTWRNYQNSHDFIPVSAQGGMNFFIGNSKEAMRLMALQPGIDWDKMAFSPYSELGKNKKSSEYSDWFFQKTFRDIKAAPGAWLRLLAKKSWWTLTGEEMEPNNNIDYYRGESWLLRLLLLRVGGVWIPFGLVIPLFILGLLRKRAGPETWLILGLLLSYIASLVLFHVRARYRLPMAPVMLPFAAAGLLWLATEAFKDLKTAAPKLALALSAALLVNLPLVDTTYARHFRTEYFIAKAYADKDKQKQAARHFKQALKDDPNLAEAHVDYAATLLKLKNKQEARSHLESAARLAPQSPQVRKTLADFYRKEAQILSADPRKTVETAAMYEKANREFRAAIKNDPFDLSLLYDLGFTLDTAGRIEESRDVFREYMEKAKDDPAEKMWIEKVALLLDAPVDTAAPAPPPGLASSATPAPPPAEPEGGPRISSLPEPTGDAAADDEKKVADLVQLYLRSGNPVKAVNVLESALRKNPKSATLLSYLGNALKKAGDLKNAEEAYKRSLAINPRNALALNNLANLMRDTGRLQEAVSFYQKALAVAPGNPVIERNMKMVQGRLNQQ